MPLFEIFPLFFQKGSWIKLILMIKCFRLPRTHFNHWRAINSHLCSKWRLYLFVIINCAKKRTKADISFGKRPKEFLFLCRAFIWKPWNPSHGLFSRPSPLSSSSPPLLPPSSSLPHASQIFSGFSSSPRRHFSSKQDHHHHHLLSGLLLLIPLPPMLLLIITNPWYSLLLNHLLCSV